MKRAALTVAVIFLAASAIMNFTFGLALGRTWYESLICGGVGVLAVAINALSPFYFAWHSGRKVFAVGLGVLWALALAYSLSSAVGFAATNRQAHTGAREALHANYETTKEQLEDLLAKREREKTSRYDGQIEAKREQLKTYRFQGAAGQPDPQTGAIADMTGLAQNTVRLLLLSGFAIMVELGCAITPFAALGGKEAVKAPIAMWKPKK
jgi:hypothetical protein